MCSTLRTNRASAINTNHGRVGAVDVTTKTPLSDTGNHEDYNTWRARLWERCLTSLTSSYCRSQLVKSETLRNNGKSRRIFISDSNASTVQRIRPRTAIDVKDLPVCRRYQRTLEPEACGKAMVLRERVANVDLSTCRQLGDNSLGRSNRLRNFEGGDNNNKDCSVPHECWQRPKTAAVNNPKIMRPISAAVHTSAKSERPITSAPATNGDSSILVAANCERSFDSKQLISNGRNIWSACNNTALERRPLVDNKSIRPSKDLRQNQVNLLQEAVPLNSWKPSSSFEECRQLQITDLIKMKNDELCQRVTAWLRQVQECAESPETPSFSEIPPTRTTDTAIHIIFED